MAEWMSLSMTSSGQWPASYLLSPGVEIQCFSTTSLNKEVSYLYIYRYWVLFTVGMEHITGYIYKLGVMAACVLSDPRSNC